VPGRAERGRAPTILVHRRPISSKLVATPGEGAGRRDALTAGLACLLGDRLWPNRSPPVQRAGWKAFRPVRVWSRGQAAALPGPHLASISCNGTAERRFIPGAVARAARCGNRRRCNGQGAARPAIALSRAFQRGPTPPAPPTTSARVRRVRGCLTRQPKEGFRPPQTGCLWAPAATALLCPGPLFGFPLTRPIAGAFAIAPTVL
jgi:hypothetical protein